MQSMDMRLTWPKVTTIDFLDGSAPYHYFFSKRTRHTLLESRYGSRPSQHPRQLHYFQFRLHFVSMGSPDINRIAHFERPLERLTWQLMDYLERCAAEDGDVNIEECLSHWSYDFMVTIDTSC